MVNISRLFCIFLFFFIFSCATAKTTKTIILTNDGSSSGKSAIDEKIAKRNKTIEIKSRDADAYHNRGRGVAYGKKGQYDLTNDGSSSGKSAIDKKIAKRNKTMEINSRDADAYHNRGRRVAYGKKGQYDQAIQDNTKVIEIEPKHAKKYFFLGVIYGNEGRYARAIQNFTKAIEINPRDATAYNNLSWLLATCPDAAYRNGNKAIEYAKKAVGLKPNAESIDTLAATYAEDSKFEYAISSQEKAISMLKEEGNTSTIDRYKKRLRLYKAHKPYREEEAKR